MIHVVRCCTGVGSPCAGTRASLHADTVFKINGCLLLRKIQWLSISTLQAFAVLVGLKVCCGEPPAAHRAKIQVMPTWTDNCGNGAALTRLVSTRFPVSAANMELGACLQLCNVHRGLRTARTTFPFFHPKHRCFGGRSWRKP